MAGPAQGRGRLGTRHRRGRRSSALAPMSEINVTPMVDVMLVLLVIFMVTAPLLSAGVPIELPPSHAKPLTQAPKQVTVTMTRAGVVFLDHASLAPGEIARRIAAMPPSADGKPPLVLLRADRGLDYGSVVNVMGELNRAGITAISLVTGSEVARPSPARPLTAGSGARP